MHTGNVFNYIWGGDGGGGGEGALFVKGTWSKGDTFLAVLSYM